MTALERPFFPILTPCRIEGYSTLEAQELIYSRGEGRVDRKYRIRIDFPHLRA